MSVLTTLALNQLGNAHARVWRRSRGVRSDMPCSSTLKLHINGLCRCQSCCRVDKVRAQATTRCVSAPLVCAFCVCPSAAQRSAMLCYPNARMECSGNGRHCGCVARRVVLCTGQWSCVVDNDVGSTCRIDNMTFDMLRMVSVGHVACLQQKIPARTPAQTRLVEVC